MTKRFTIDGSPELETALERRCGQARDAVLAKVPARLIEAIVLGGGYGRGEGGVLRSDTPNGGDQPYNDLEFYVFFRRHRLWQTCRYERVLHETGHRLSSEFGLDVEFKIDGTARWRRGPVSMFSYDLVSGHRVIFGDESVFEGCSHHAEAAAIPLDEATRLMFNRCAGLLLVRALLQKGALTAQETDFAGRNLAKAQLALGDAVLAAHGLYHWSARERHQRLVALDEPVPRLLKICAHHEIGLDFKLHPFRASESLQQLKAQHRELAELAQCVWLWLESRRLQRPFASAPDYALSTVDKCPGKSSLRNHFLHWRTFGLKAAMRVVSSRYPRSRLFNALALLLWCPDMSAQPAILRRLQEELETSASDWSGLVSVFNQIWPAYG